MNLVPENQVESKNKIVKLHNDFIQMSHNCNKLQMDVLLLAISKINDDNLEVRIPIKELYKYKTNKQDKLHLDLELDKLRTLFFTVNSNEFIIKPKMNIISYHNGYKQGSGYIEIGFNKDFIQILRGFKNRFTKIDLKEVLKIQSVHSKRIYLLINCFNGIKSIIPEFVSEKTIDEIKFMFNIDYEYKYIKKHILNKAKIDLEKIGITLDFKPIPFKNNIKKIDRIQFIWKFEKNKTQIQIQQKELDFKNSEPIYTYPDIESIPEPIELEDWEIKLQAEGIHLDGINTIKNALNEGKIDKGYILFVVDYLHYEKQKGTIFRTYKGSLLDRIRNSEKYEIEIDNKTLNLLECYKKFNNLENFRKYLETGKIIDKQPNVFRASEIKPNMINKKIEEPKIETHSAIEILKSKKYLGCSIFSALKFNGLTDLQAVMILELNKPEIIHKKLNEICKFNNENKYNFEDNLEEILSKTLEIFELK